MARQVCRWSMRHEYMLALYIELGDVAAEPGSEPAGSRLPRIARARGITEEAFRQDLTRMRTVRVRRPPLRDPARDSPGS